MSAMPAVELRFKNRSPVSKISKAKARKGKKVVKLFLKKNNTPKQYLSEKKREELVLEFRMKARKLARSILRKWHARLDLQEVDSIVDLSLCEAVRRFNPARGASFMTFLYYHMRGNLIRAITTAASANTVPLGDFENNENSSQSNGESGLNNCHSTSAIEVAAALSGQDYLLPDEVLFKKEMAQISQEACGKLDNLEKEVVERIYLHEQQLMDIAQTLGYSRCHISRVKKKALETLYDEVLSTLDEDLPIARPATFDEEEQPVVRRKVHRRRPRSLKSLRLKAEKMAAACHA